MKLHFYGTGASEGVPALFCQCENCKKIRKLGGKNFRSRTSCQIDEDLMIDFSADVFDHMRSGGLDMNQIRYLMITHAHTDHFYPEELLHIAPPYAFGEKKEALKVYGNHTVCKRLEELGAGQIEQYLKVSEIKNYEEIVLRDYRIRALPAEHDRTQECHLYLIEKKGKRLLYAHDTALFSEEIWNALEGLRLDGVVLDCTCCNGPTHFSSHMGFAENIKIQKRMFQSGMADLHTVFIATHFVHTFGPFQDELEQAFKPYGFLAAYDGMEVEI